ncbi:hypothetical protein BH20ACT3_BH20ACT3_06230 [soil metagenome]
MLKQADQDVQVPLPQRPGQPPPGRPPHHPPGPSWRHPPALLRAARVERVRCSRAAPDSRRRDLAPLRCPDGGRRGVTKPPVRRPNGLARVAAGGHDVPEEKIRSRWRRLWANVVAMIELADSAEVFDNAGPGPVTIATFVAGDIVGAPAGRACGWLARLDRPIRLGTIWAQFSAARSGTPWYGTVRGGQAVSPPTPRNRRSERRNPLLSRGFRSERTTGFEPATLTLAR